MLRGFIEKGKVLLNSENVAQIDRNVVDAFLRVRRYKHGARSMESILGMCKTWEKGIEKCSVPPKGQLDLHTEGEDFLQLIEKMPSPINRMSATIFDPAGQPSEL